MSLLPLFDDQPTEPSPLAARLRSLSHHGVHIGTSSWKYPGWLGKIYTPERYFTRGRFSQKKFEAECLNEYAETFPIVCGDFTFYQFPSSESWARLFGSAPKTLMYAFKVPEEITVPIWPLHARYGSRAGTPNENFLNAAVFMDLFLAPLEPYRAQVAALIFEFGAMSPSVYPNGALFADDLARFLDALPKAWRYSVEIRNPEFLTPYHFDCLRKRGVAHVFNAWTRMPALHAQIAIPESHTADFTVTRALLRQGRPYEQAVKQFAPYEEVRDIYAAGRSSLKGIIDHGLNASQSTFLFVNNRFEGNAPGTIAAVIGDAPKHQEPIDDVPF
jgi:uncharacterized protein YecE (DUF72 family)